MALLGAASCRSTGADDERPSAEAAAELVAVRRLEDRGDVDDAAARCRRLVSSQPKFVAARRELQNLAIADHRRGELLVEERALLQADPRSATRWYLYGRLLADSEAQHSAFERARDLDDHSPWPWLGLGVLDLAKGDAATSLAELRRALELAPESREVELALVRTLLADPSGLDLAQRRLAGALDEEPWDVARVLLLADLRARQQRPRESLELLGRLLLRFPRSREVADRLFERLDRLGTLEDAEWLARLLDPAATEPLVRRVVARCHAMRGESAAAIAAWNELPALSSDERARRRLFHVARGELRAAFEYERTRFAALARLGVTAPAWEFVSERLASPTPQEGVARVDLAQAFVRLGWVAEATALLREAPEDARSPARVETDGAESLLARLRLEQQLEAELRIVALESYRAFETDHTTLDFEPFVARLESAAARVVGDDRLTHGDVVSFWPVGELLDPTSESGLPEWLRQNGRLLVAGRRHGRPAELLLAPVLARGVAGPQHAELSFVEGTLVPGLLEHEGARFAGAALDRFVYVDVAAVEDDVARVVALERRLGDQVERVLADPAVPAADRAQRIAVDEPAEVATKLELRALREWRALDAAADPAERLAQALDAVLQHEVGHLEDAHRFLPLSDHLAALLWQLAQLHFSPTRVEEWLEMRAECVALARARNPYFVLAGCAGQSRAGATLTPHGAGYGELLERLVAQLDAAPDDFPQLDRSRNLLQQLDRLTVDQVHLAARRVQAELGIE